MNWKAFLHAIVAAAIGGAATAATGALTTGMQGGKVQWGAVGGVAAAGAVTSALALLKQSPIEPSK